MEGAFDTPSTKKEKTHHNYKWNIRRKTERSSKKKGDEKGEGRRILRCAHMLQCHHLSQKSLPSLNQCLRNLLLAAAAPPTTATVTLFSIFFTFLCAYRCAACNLWEGETKWLKIVKQPFTLYSFKNVYKLQKCPSFCIKNIFIF